jgi:hypothetical protein
VSRTISHVLSLRVCMTMPTVTRARCGRHTQQRPEPQRRKHSWSPGSLQTTKVSGQSDQSVVI